MDKIVHIGRGPNGNVFCRIKLTSGKLSITGVEGPKTNGDAKGSCGQIIMHEWHLTSYAPGWDEQEVAKFRSIWDRWHLNDMQAGTPAQMEFVRAHPTEYTTQCTRLQAAGLNPDNGYYYGSKWLFEELPADIVAYLQELPESAIVPAWV